MNIRAFILTLPLALNCSAKITYGLLAVTRLALPASVGKLPRDMMANAIAADTRGQIVLSCTQREYSVLSVAVTAHVNQGREIRG